MKLINKLQILLGLSFSLSLSLSTKNNATSVYTSSILHKLLKAFVFILI
jgi:hypothetical protein